MECGELLRGVSSPAVTDLCAYVRFRFAATGPFFVPYVVAARVKPPARAIAEIQLVLRPAVDWLATATTRQARGRAAPHSGGYVRWKPISCQQIPDALPNYIGLYPISFVRERGNFLVCRAYVRAPHSLRLNRSSFHIAWHCG